MHSLGISASTTTAFVQTTLAIASTFFACSSLFDSVDFSYNFIISHVAHSTYLDSRIRVKLAIFFQFYLFIILSFYSKFASLILSSIFRLSPGTFMIVFFIAPCFLVAALDITMRFFLVPVSIVLVLFCPESFFIDCICSPDQIVYCICFWPDCGAHHSGQSGLSQEGICFVPTLLFSYSVVHGRVICQSIPHKPLLMDCVKFWQHYQDCSSHFYQYENLLCLFDALILILGSMRVCSLQYIERMSEDDIGSALALFEKINDFVLFEWGYNLFLLGFLIALYRQFITF